MKMKNLTSEQIRQLRDEFWQHPDRNHAYLKYASLVPDSSDKTVLFTTAWMQQLVPYLVGKPHPQWKRLYNIQKSLRTWDIDEVWDERHLTCFEMMGNWSLWDYFKKESLKWSIQFLNECLHIPLEKMWASIFAWDDVLWIGEDTEARQILNDLSIPNQRIKALWMDENFWGPAGEVWPCGPCTEIHVDRGSNWWKDDWNIWENDRFLEVWNNVFMEFYKNEDWTFSKLSQQNVDTGMWIERLCLILQWTQTVFETDLFSGIMDEIQKATQISYPPFWKNENDLNSQEKIITKNFRIIADHIRTSVFMIWDGVVPSNEFRGYVLRRLIRRLYHSLIMLNSKVDYKDFVWKVFQKINKKYWWYYIQIPSSKDQILNSLISEIDQFRWTIQRWKNILEKIFSKTTNNVISGDDLFQLYDTYGFPVELTKEIAEQKWFDVDIQKFYEKMEEAKEVSRKWTKDVFKRWVDWGKYLDWIKATKFMWYDSLDLENIEILKDFTIDWQRVIVLDKTPFYAESGGQTSDIGRIKTDKEELLKVKDVQNITWVYLHFID